MKAAGRRLAITSWNIAAINNNPFEYWITYQENKEYEKLMINIENFLEDPGDQDVKVSKVFTEEMFSKLDARMISVGWKSARSYWGTNGLGHISAMHALLAKRYQLPHPPRSPQNRITQIE